MSKRDTFKRNILAMTRTRTLGKAIAGWELVQDISLPKDSPSAACGLCGTLFRSGARLRLPATRTRKEVIVPVGGTCLGTILRGSFTDLAVITERTKAVHAKLRQVYGTLIEDPGNWIKWLVENVPARLRPLAAQLRHLGKVSTDRDLNRLIAFHDAHRKYPVGALLPIVDGSARSLSLPSTLTVDEARAFVHTMTPVQWRRLLARRSERFRIEEIDPKLTLDVEWREAWARLSKSGQRAVIALAKASEDKATGIHVFSAFSDTVFPAVPSMQAVPFFVWVNGLGLGLFVELSDDVDDEAVVRIWRDREEHDVDLGDCRAVVDVTEDVVLAIASRAFWNQPPWFKGRLPAFSKTPKRKRGDHRNAAPTPADRDDESHALSQIPCVAKMLDIARFKGKKTTLDAQVAWLKARIDKMGIDWSDFEYQFKRYSTNPDCRDKINRIQSRL